MPCNFVGSPANSLSPLFIAGVVVVELACGLSEFKRLEISDSLEPVDLLDGLANLLDHTST